MLRLKMSAAKKNSNNSICCFYVNIAYMIFKCSRPYMKCAHGLPQYLLPIYN